MVVSVIDMLNLRVITTKFPMDHEVFIRRQAGLQTSYPVKPYAHRHTQTTCNGISQFFTRIAPMISFPLVI